MLVQQLTMGLTVQGSIPSGARDLFAKTCQQLALGAMQPPVQWVLEQFPGVKWLGHSINHPAPPSNEEGGGETETEAIPQLPFCAFMAHYREIVTVLAQKHKTEVIKNILK